MTVSGSGAPTPVVNENPVKQAILTEGVSVEDKALPALSKDRHDIISPEKKDDISTGTPDLERDSSTTDEGSTSEDGEEDFESASETEDSRSSCSPDPSPVENLKISFSATKRPMTPEASCSRKKVKNVDRNEQDGLRNQQKKKT